MMRDRRDIDPASSSSGFTRTVDTGLRDFMEATGRSDRNPFGDAGMFGSRPDYSGIMTPQQIDSVNRLAYEQAKGLISGQGFQGRGMSEPKVGYAPALKIGSSIPGGTVQLAPQPEPTSGLGGLGSFLRGGGLIGQLLGGGNRLRVFQPDEAPVPSRLLDQVNEKVNQISNEQKINGGITGTRIDDTPTQVKPEEIPGAYQTAGLDAIDSGVFLNPAVRRLLEGARDYLSEDPGIKFRGGSMDGPRYQFNINPRERSGRFDFKMPVQDLGIGNLFSQNMDPRQNFRMTV